MSARNRKDLDDVSEKTRVPLRSCRRQVKTNPQLLKKVNLVNYLNNWCLLVMDSNALK